MPDKIIRSFLPVGNGSFALEEIDGKSFVFGCGAATAVAAENRVNHYFFPDMPVEAVFISRLHGEQFNGLERLLEWCRVKRLFLPQFGDIHREALLKGRMRVFEREFIRDPEGTVHYISPNTKIIYIGGGKDGTLEQTPLDSVVKSTTLPSGGALTIGKYSDWMFLPCGIGGGITVYSGPSSPEIRKRGALYLGDCDVSAKYWEEVERHYQDCFGCLSVLTVPLHGDAGHFNPLLAALECDKIIFAQNTSPPWLDHPHGQVILTLKRGKGRYYICTAKNGKRYILQPGRRKSARDIRYVRGGLF
jgi:hypothetical protein